jgi:hypothetical protein
VGGSAVPLDGESDGSRPKPPMDPPDWRPLMAVMRLLRCSAVSAARTVSCCQPPSGTTPLSAAMAEAA